MSETSGGLTAEQTTALLEKVGLMLAETCVEIVNLVEVAEDEAAEGARQWARGQVFGARRASEMLTEIARDIRRFSEVDEKWWV